jgi:DNA-binding HxlR family transcriptional regulator
LAANRVNGSENGERSGAQTLALLATPLTVNVLRVLAAGPRHQAELRREVGSPAQTTLRAQLRRLAEIGAVEKQRRNRFPGAFDIELAPAGRDLLAVLAVLESWLRQAPSGAIELATDPAKATIKALAEGWSTTMLRALAAGPLSLTELDGLIVSLSYPSLDRRLSALRLAGLVEANPGNGRGTPYAVTEWLRQGVRPLAASARWERRHLADAVPLGRLDIETALLLATPLLRAPDELTGSCRLAAEADGGGDARLAGVLVEVESGRVVSCSTRLQGSPSAWAVGPGGAWLDALLGQDGYRLELGGDCAFARSLLIALDKSLSTVPLNSLLENRP